MNLVLALLMAQIKSIKVNHFHSLFSQENLKKK